MADDNIKHVIEALLFSSDMPLSLEQMRAAFDHQMQPQDLRQAIAELAAEYESSQRGVRIAEVAGGFRMTTAAEYISFLRKLYKNRRADRLSKPALETLAIIAYKQPLTRGEIQSLRNVNIDGVMKSLMDRDLIRITGRKTTPGRPHVYGTTKLFLEYFGLKSLEDLPKMEDFSQLPAVSELQAQPLSDESPVDQDVPANGAKEKDDGLEHTAQAH